MSRPGFDSLRNFVAHEIDMITSEYAQAFFKSDDREQAQSSGSKTYRVRQTTVGPEKSSKSDSLSTSSNSESSKTAGMTNPRSRPSFSDSI